MHYAVMMHSVLELIDLDIGPEGSKVNVDEILEWSRLLGYASPRVFEHAASCQLKYFSSETTVVYSNVTMSFFMVPIWLFLSLLAFLIVRIFVNSLTPIELGLSGPLNAVWMIQLYTVHIRITRMLREVFICKTFDAARLLWNPEIFCADSNHWKWECIAFIGVAEWSIGIPMFFLYTLFNVHQHGTLSKLSTRKVLGFFYVGFSPSCFFFEPIFMLRGVLFQLCSALAIMNAPAVPVGEQKLSNAAPIAMLALVSFCAFFQWITTL
jgi:hypothetical protein